MPVMVTKINLEQSRKKPTAKRTVDITVKERRFHDLWLIQRSEIKKTGKICKQAESKLKKTKTREQQKQEKKKKQEVQRHQKSDKTNRVRKQQNARQKQRTDKGKKHQKESKKPYRTIGKKSGQKGVIGEAENTQKRLKAKN